MMEENAKGAKGSDGMRKRTIDDPGNQVTDFGANAGTARPTKQSKLLHQEAAAGPVGCLALVATKEPENVGGNSKPSQDLLVSSTHKKLVPDITEHSDDEKGEKIRPETDFKQIADEELVSQVLQQRDSSIIASPSTPHSSGFEPSSKLPKSSTTILEPDPPQCDPDACKLEQVAVSQSPSESIKNCSRDDPLTKTSGGASISNKLNDGRCDIQSTVSILTTDADSTKPGSTEQLIQMSAGALPSDPIGEPMSEDYRTMLLQEQIFMIEASLKLLRKRRDETMHSMRRSNTVQRKSVANIMSLQRRRAMLRKRQAQQSKLTGEIRASMAQTMARLDQLANCKTVEEMERLAEAETNQAIGRQTTISACDEDSDMEIDENTASLEPSLPVEAVIRWPTADALWRNSGPYLLIALAGKEHIKRAMNVISNEVNDDSRRDYLRNSCLDIKIFLPSGEHSEQERLKATNIQPNVPICPYELAGVCADPECSYQHLEERPLGAVLPRELLPLPKLRLVGRVAKAKQAKTVESPIGEVEVDDIEDNNDFVALPKIDDSPIPMLAGSFDDPCPYWWIFETALEYKDPVSLFADLGVAFSSRQNQNISIRCQDCELVYQAIIVDCCAFALHSGRLDIYATLSSLSGAVLESILDKIGCVAVDLNSSRNIFERSFNAQLSLVALALVMETSYELNEPLIETTVPENFLQGLWSPKSGTAKAGNEAISDSLFDDDIRASNTVEEIKQQIYAAHQECINISDNISLGADASRDQVGKVLFRGLEALRRMINRSSGRSSKLASLKAIIFMGRIVFRLVKRQASSFGFDEGASRELCVAVDKVMRSLRALTTTLPSAELLLAPIVAANVALAVSLRCYDKAQNLLQFHLIGNSHSSSAEFPHPEFQMSYSELLWSQLVQLRATLPNRDVDPTRRTEGTKRKTRKENQVFNDQLAGFIDQRNVFPRHVHFYGDEFIDGKSEACKTYKRKMHGHVTSRAAMNKGNDSLSLRGVPLYHPEQSVVSSIPLSILWFAPSLTELDLSSTKLPFLPPLFGEYFSNVKRLDLSNNEITKLPNTLSLLDKIEELNVSSNKLQHLPEMLKMKSLKILNASNNNITRLPESSKQCSQLEVLHVDGNPLEVGVFWKMVSELPRLRDLKPQKF